jgi:hypothetical protein
MADIIYYDNVADSQRQGENSNDEQIAFAMRRIIASTTFLGNIIPKEE